MLFELSLSQPTLVTIFGRRLSVLEQACWGLPPVDASAGVPMVDRVELKGDPQFTGVVEPHEVLLADGSTVTVDGLRLRLTQHFAIHTATLTADLVRNGPLPGDASVALAIRMVVADGDAQLCVEFEGLNLPYMPSGLAVAADVQARSLLPTTCIPMPVSDLLDGMVSQLPLQGAVFTTTDVLNAGMAMVPGTESLAVRIEVDTVDRDAAQAWADFHQGIGITVIGAIADPAGTTPEPAAWTFTADRRLFGRILTSMIPAIEDEFARTQTGHLVLLPPTAQWHPSADLIGWDFTGLWPRPIVVETGLPMLTASMSGTAYNVCPGVFGRADIGFTADVTLAFAVPDADVLRLYTHVKVDPDDIDEWVCAGNISASISPSLAAVLGPIGVVIGTFIAVVIVSMAGDSVGQLPVGPTCHEEFGLTVCDMPWNGGTSIGPLHLSAATGTKQGLVLLGSLTTPVPGHVPQLAPRVDWPFAWEYQGCDPDAGIDDLHSIDARVFTGARVCDARVLDHTDTYEVRFTPGGAGVQVRYLRPATEPITTDPCRLLIATSDGLALFVVPPPPQLTAEYLEKIREVQSIGCRRDLREKKEYRRPPHDHEIVRFDRDLVVLHARVAELAHGQEVQLLSEGRVIGSGRAGRFGLAVVTATLTAGADLVELSVAPAPARAGTVRIVATGRPAATGQLAAAGSPIRASREIWRHMGRVAVVGELRDVVSADMAWWLATSHGLVRFELHADRTRITHVVPRSGLRRLAATEFGLVAGGDSGLDILDPATGAMRAHHDTGPVRMLAGRRSILLTGTDDAVRAYQLRWAPDGRGRTRLPALDLVDSHDADGVRTGVLVGRLLVVGLADRLAAYEVRQDGTLAPSGSLALRGLQGVYGTINADSGGAVVAVVGDAAVVVDTDSLVESGRSLVDLQRQPDTLAAARMPWFVGTHRAGNVLVRADRTASTVDVYTLLDRVDLVRREALFAHLFTPPPPPPRTPARPPTSGVG